MTNKSIPKLSNAVRIRQHYQRSIRLDADFGRLDALEGYICHRTASAALETMSRQILESNQRAFTWTGPFGGGKSSLAVSLASALCPEKALRRKARSILHVEEIVAFDKAFPSNRGWLIVPVVGKRGSVSEEISKSLRTALGGGKGNRKAASGSVISDLVEAADDSRYNGVVLLIDEMGKFLESSALGIGDDVYFFQDLAESAARTNGRLVVIGILHQSFRQYAARLGIETRDDWAKVQGRFADIPLITASDEMVELIGKAIETDAHPRGTLAAAEAVADSMRKRRPAVGKDFSKSLNACWPLHPVMAALLGPVSKRQFGQNERSAFGFLSSVEPHGFRAFIQTNPLSGPSWYRPDNYWDYLRANLESAILASPDGHRWAQAVDAVERAEAKEADSLHVAIIKSIAVIDLFRNGSGLAAEESVLLSIFDPKQHTEVLASLEQLAKWRVVLFKKHIGAWSVFEGSDFDIEAAISHARASLPGVDFDALSRLANLYPAIAKRHYYETGTLRWMDVALCRLEEAERLAEEYAPRKGEFGLFLLALPDRETNIRTASRKCAQVSRIRPWPVVVGMPANYARISDLGIELLALQAVQARPELEGDSVARREVAARISATRSNLEEQLRAAAAVAKWHVGEIQARATSSLSPLASELADHIYSKAPHVWSELVNRDNLSSNSVKARRDLLHRMLSNEGEESLGIEGFPAERGLYETLLNATGLHRRHPQTGVWGFMPPERGHAESLIDLWQAARDLFTGPEDRVGAEEIGKIWSAPPYGLRLGIHPVFITAFLLAHKRNVAVYKDGVFIPSLSDADIDEFLQDEHRFSLRWVTIDEDKAKILRGISQILSEIGRGSAAQDPLEAARALVSMVLSLPAWSQRTQRLSQEARVIRDTLHRASDPHKVLFVDLASILGKGAGAGYIKALRGPLHELANAYGDMLDKIESTMLEALDAPPDDLSSLRDRADTVAQATGDLRQDAFAAYLLRHDGSRASIEAILSLAANKPPRDWSDRDIDAALLEVAKFSLRFRQAEALMAVRGRKPTSDAFAVVIGAGASAQTFSRQFDLSERHRVTVENLADEIAAGLATKGLKTEVLLAALARAGLRLATDEETERG